MAAFSWSHTVAPGTNCLVLLVAAHDAFDGFVSSATWNGVEAFSMEIENYHQDFAVTIMWLENPTVTTANISVTMDGNCGDVGGYGVDLLGVDCDGDPTLASDYSEGTGTTITVATGASVASGDMSVGVCLTAANDIGLLSVSQGTEISEIDHGFDVSGDAYRAGSDTIQWVLSGDAEWYNGVVATFDALYSPAPSSGEAAAAQIFVAGREQQLALSIETYQPSIDVDTPYYDPEGRYLYRLTDMLNGLTFTTQADGGYWSADITLSATQDIIDEWLDEGLGRFIVIRNPALEVIWEGEVNAVEATMSSLTVTRGPLHDITNRASVAYTRVIDANSDPPVLGNQAVTTIVENDRSQELYGVLESVLSGGTVETDTAEQMRDTYLAENHRPQTSERLSIGQPQQPQVTLRCLGYVHRFKKYIIAFTTTGTTDIQSKITDVLNACPNGLMSTPGWDEIGYNAWLVVLYDYENRTAWDVIQEMLDVGDVNDDRWTFGVYQGHKSRYEMPMDDETAYSHRIDQRGQFLETQSHGLVEPWDIQPAKWLFLPDFLGTMSRAVERKNDPRYIFIESVTFTAPYTVAINGMRVERLPQLLAKYR